jgi:predicted MFS family arabinose efflux permease
MTATGMGAATNHVTPLPPLHRNRDFMVLWTSQVVSTVGTRISSIAYPLLVLSITGSPVQAGIVAFAQTLPFLVLFLPAGALVDRWNRRRIMLWCEVGRAIALGSVAMTTMLGTVTVGQLVVVALVEGSLFVFFDLCEGAALPRIVAPEQLPAAMAQNQARTQGADLVGQPLGGWLFGLGRALPFAVDAVSYVVSFVALLSIRSPLQIPRTREPSHLRAEIAEGLRTLWQQPFLRTSMVVVAGQNFAWNALTLLLIVRAQALGASPALVGGMFAFFGAGALLGAIVAPRTQRRFGIRALLVAISWLWAIQFAALSVVQDVVVLGLIAGIGSVAGPIFNVAFGTVLYGLTPDRLLGRVRSVAKAIAWGTIPLGALAAGFLADAFGATAGILAMAIVLVAMAVVATLSRAMQTIPGVDAATAAGEMR